MKLYSALVAAATAAMLTSACDDNSTIGESIFEDRVAIVADSSFVITGSSRINSSIPSRSVTQLIGRLRAGDFGHIESSVVTQFMPASVIDTAGITSADIDSLKLVLGVLPGNFTGDSIVPMGITVYPLNKALPSPIYSNFSPEGYYDPTPVGTTIYNTSLMARDTIDTSTQLDEITVKLPQTMARALFDEFKNSPSTYASPEAFTRFFPGLYITNSYGSGRLTSVSLTAMRMYYHRTMRIEGTERDTTIYRTGSYFAVTPEVVTNNIIDLSLSTKLQDRVDRGENIVVAPAGLDVTVKFPARDIIERYRSDKATYATVNSLTFSLPAETIENDYGINPPTYLLMVRSDKRADFFANNELPDNVNSFYAIYNSDKGTYTFPNMRSYLLDLMEKDEITDDDVTFTITPVNIEFEESSSYYDSDRYETSVTPWITSPVMVRLLLDKAKIKLIYSRQSTNI